jgi:hypothetical protein
VNRYRRSRVLAGVLAWGAIVAIVGAAFLPADGAARETAREVSRYLTSSPRRVEAVLPAGVRLAAGDPVFVDDPDLYLVRVGRVGEVRAGDGEAIALLLVYPEHAGALREGATATAHTVPSTAAWVVRTLVPPERARAIREEAARFLEAEGKAIGDALWPEVRLALLDLLALYREEVPAVLKRHSARIQALAKRHREGVIEEELVPVVEEVVLARARERFRPLLEEAGVELWKALPIWSLGVKYLWEKVPGTPDEQVRKRFEKYLKSDAEPIIRKHAPQAVRIAGEVLRESLKDERVKAAIAEVAETIASDPETGAILRDLLRDLFLENERLPEVLDRRWKAGLGAAVAEAARRFEPLVRRVADSIALTPDRKSINPRLARVLRARVMRKDTRWVLLTAGDGGPIADGARIPGSVGLE